MAHLFCHSCGHKMEYAHAKPNFCAKCGQQLNASISANTAQDTPTIQKSVVLSDNETDAESVPVITDFQVDYEVSDRPTMTLGSLIGEPTPSEYKGDNKTSSLNEFIDEKKKQR